MSSQLRHILHFDMDAFYAAVEQRDDPALRGKPVLVGGDPRGRGVVSTASYEARPFGCRSAMPMAQAIRLCPQAIVLPPRMERYAAVSRQVFDVLDHFTPLVEPLSIDEAFLDVTGSTRLLGKPLGIACDVKERIRAETGLTASVGLAPNKFLAKLASDLQKPDGLLVVPADGVQDFLDPLPIERLWGAGPATQRRLEKLNVRTFGDLRQVARATLRDTFGESGEHFHRLVRGIDDRPVVPDRAAKSVSHEVTFAEDVADREHLRAVLLHQVEQVAQRLRRHAQRARTVTVKIRTPDFVTVTRRTTLNRPTDETDVLWQAAVEVFERWARRNQRSVRLIGVGAGQLHAPTAEQLDLFAQQDADRRRQLDRVTDLIRGRYGQEAISRGGSLRRRHR